MNELELYIKNKTPLRDSEVIRYEMTKKAQQVADKYFPADKEKNELCANSYLLAMYDIMELIYS